ncbi:2-C-methyl-D-erythritol 4-phosphate cytidylyltransferase [Dysgonomonas sp. 520]|uniref:2-C-methyl-D-erythritol 4-phosphate cytidylyltransferase n=1 Tax=Dysgonomonas sp. 520 TaxID=2302931 RepID=UPI0013D010CC|nr:2-C-methyl-D-erythritol 4-phosphate cytidylyltransferase [Dysgonomonas sp. 520]NDW08404.1 2-C-methyl-D-erythritol 4-phosphate cytidylyltransferase [Dysgonomonas sp. 520]
MPQTKSVIIVAGGKGLRMGHDLPKQFIPIGGKPVLMRTMEAFYNYDSQVDIVLVLSPDYYDYWQKLCEEYQFSIPHQMTQGGETRYHSVKNGLSLVTSDVVAVHDAARPFVSNDLIERCFENIDSLKAVVPAIEATDSLREMTDGTHSKIIDRSKIRLVQTPQVFSANILKEAYRQEYTSVFTDDASVVESIGIAVHLVKGETTNIKITTPFDLEVAKLLLKD